MTVQSGPKVNTGRKHAMAGYTPFLLLLRSGAAQTDFFLAPKPSGVLPTDRFGVGGGLRFKAGRSDFTHGKIGGRTEERAKRKSPIPNIFCNINLPATSRLNKCFFQGFFSWTALNSLPSLGEGGGLPLVSLLPPPSNLNLYRARAQLAAKEESDDGC